MNLSDPAMALLAASGGDTVKLFDVSVKAGDPCALTYTPSPGCLVNSVKWNHTSQSLFLSLSLFGNCISSMFDLLGFFWWLRKWMEVFFEFFENLFLGYY